MDNVFSLIGAGSTLVLVGLCIKLAKNHNYVDRVECHKAMDELKNYISARFEDLKDFMLKNGK